MNDAETIDETILSDAVIQEAETPPPAVKTTPGMEVATAWVVFDRQGSNVEKHGITPAEARVLQAMHLPHTGNNPVTRLKITSPTAVVITEWEIKVVGQKAIGKTKDGEPVYEDVTERKPKKTRVRTNADEIGRLRRKYGQYTVKKDGNPVNLLASLYPGDVPNLPRTFAEVGFKEGVNWAAPEAPASNAMPGTHAPSDEDFAFIYRSGE